LGDSKLRFHVIGIEHGHGRRLVINAIYFRL